MFKTINIFSEITPLRWGEWRIKGKEFLTAFVGVTKTPQRTPVTRINTYFILANALDIKA